MQIPQTVFYENPKHLRIIADILKDYQCGERNILLIGPQGTGKNKVTDHLLQSLRVEREYLQLHRDTTVSSLTLSPTLEDGIMKWEDSPLVKVKKGIDLLKASLTRVDSICAEDV